MANRVKKKTRKEGFESEVLSGTALNYNDKVDFVKAVNMNNKNYVYPLYQTKVQFFVYEFLKTYLHALHTGALANNKIKILNFAALASNANPVITAPQIANYNENGLAVIENHSVYAYLEYDGAPYQVTVFLVSRENGMFSDLKYFISVLGVCPESYKTDKLATYLSEEAMKNSIYKKSILNLKFDTDERVDIQKMDINEFKDESIDDIFIPTMYKTELLKFHKCVAEYDNIGMRLRYMLSGKPGTGKTKSVRTLINMCYGEATIILTEGNIDFKALFDFAKLFEPAIICLDDLDLLIGNRERSYSPNFLGAFLQELDGFDKNNVFLLATTNDKSLVDMAASRPLRFDLTLDFGRLDNRNYSDLIKANTKDENILQIFDNDLLESLKKKKVTGAFIVNLIRQAEIMKKLQPNYNLRNYLNDFIEMSYKGFYNEFEEDQVGFGFSLDRTVNEEVVDL